MTGFMLTPAQPSTPLGPPIGMSPLDPALFFGYPFLFFLHWTTRPQTGTGPPTLASISKVEIAPNPVNYFSHKK